MKNKKTNNTLLIKNYEIKSKVILAPMAGITSFSYRKFMHEFNPNALTFTEMISDFGLIYDNEKNAFFYHRPAGVRSGLGAKVQGLLCL